MKVAILHPWFLELGGAERVVDALAQMYPNADFFALAADPSMLPPHVDKGRLHTNPFLNKLLTSRLRTRRASFGILFPMAVEQMDLRPYDLVLGSCPPMMGVNVNQDAMHICYCHTPQRAWWHLYAERQSQLGWVARQAFVGCSLFVRMWEFSAMQRADHIVSNSNYVASRIFKYFRRQSTVIYPPVDTAQGYLSESPGDYFLSVSRLDVDKRLDLLIHACNSLKRRLLIVGTGRAERQLKAIAGPTVEFLGHVQDTELRELYANCRAFLFAADEDFGIVSVEAQSYGRPVIAYGYGGSLETARVNDPGERADTGVFFSKQTTESVVDGILRFEAREEIFIPAEIQRYARQFDTSVFKEKMRGFVDTAVKER